MRGRGQTKQEWGIRGVIVTFYRLRCRTDPRKDVRVTVRIQMRRSGRLAICDSTVERPKNWGLAAVQLESEQTAIFAADYWSDHAAA